MERDEISRSNRQLLRRVLLTLGALDLAVIVIVLVFSLWGVALGLARGEVVWAIVGALAAIVLARIVLGFRLRPKESGRAEPAQLESPSQFEMDR